jgi:hypothetical protein
MPVSGLATEIDDFGYRSESPKTPCGCGCKGDSSLRDASIPASPQFIHELHEEVIAVLGKAKQIRKDGVNAGQR